MSTDQQTGQAIKRVQARHHRALSEALAPLGVTLVQWDALRALDAHPDASLHDLAQRTFQTDQSYGALAKRMVDRGLVDRVPGPGRVLHHRLTREGRRVLAAGADLVDAALAASFAPLSAAERRGLDRALRRLLEA